MSDDDYEETMRRIGVFFQGVVLYFMRVAYIIISSVLIMVLGLNPVVCKQQAIIERIRDILSKGW